MMLWDIMYNNQTVANCPLYTQCAGERILKIGQ